MDQKEALAAAIKQLLGKTKQSELARKAKIKESVLSDYVNAKRYPRQDNLAKLAHGLGCTTERLEEVAWQFRLASQASERPAVEDDPAQTRFHDLLFRGKLTDSDAAGDPRLKRIYEEFAAASYHTQVANSRHFTGMSLLVDFLAGTKPPATEN